MSELAFLSENYERVIEKIAMAAKRSGRHANDVLCLPVSKSVGVDKIQATYALGVRHFGENYVQELQVKMTTFSEKKITDIHWHFIGHLQTNKIKNIANKVDLIHSVDRLSVVQELAKRCNRPQNILVEINLAGEESKSGVAPEALSLLLDAIQACDNVVIQGFMFMPPLGISAAMARKFYERARLTAESSSKKLSFPHSAATLSMGTSHDFEMAIEFGATIVRLGTVIFGPRNEI